jgi:hypothetical protein
MSHRSRSPVVIDTGVFGARLTPSGRLLATRYRSLSEGRRAVLSFVTVAELQYGARFAGWGPDRLRRLGYEIGLAEVVWPGPHLVDTYVTLRAWRVRTGHSLGCPPRVPLSGSWTPRLGRPCGPSRAIGSADPRPAARSPGFGAYEEGGEEQDRSCLRMEAGRHPDRTLGSCAWRSAQITRGSSSCTEIPVQARAQLPLRCGKPTGVAWLGYRRISSQDYPQGARPARCREHRADRARGALLPGLGLSRRRSFSKRSPETLASIETMAQTRVRSGRRVERSYDRRLCVLRSPQVARGGPVLRERLLHLRLDQRPS